MTSYLELMEAFDHYPPELRALIGVVLIALLAWVANWMVKRVLLRLLSRVLRMLPVAEGQTAFDDKVVRRLSNVVPALIVHNGIALLPEVPPTAVACGESAGTPIVFAAPSRQVLPVSPAPLKTLMPAAAAVCRTLSMLVTSASVVWSSQ